MPEMGRSIFVVVASLSSCDASISSIVHSPIIRFPHQQNDLHPRASSNQTENEFKCEKYQLWSTLSNRTHSNDVKIRTLAYAGCFALPGSVTLPTSRLDSLH